MKKYKIFKFIAMLLLVFSIVTIGEIISPYIPCNIQKLGAHPNDSEFDNFKVFDKAFRTKKNVFIPAGDYYILTDQTLYIPSDFNLTMDENARIIIKTYEDFPKNVALVSRNSTNVNLTNLNITGWKLPTERNGSNGFVSFDDCTNLKLNGNTKICNANRAAVMFCGGSEINVENLNIFNCNADGVYIQGNVLNFRAEYISVINSGDDAVSIANNLTINEFGENTDGSFHNYPRDIFINEIYVDGYSKNVSVSSPAVFIAGAKRVHIGKVTCKNRDSVLRTNVGSIGEVLSSNFGGDFIIDNVESFDTKGLFLFEFKDITNYKNKDKYKTEITLGDIVCHNAQDLGYIGNNGGGLWDNLCSVEINNLQIEPSKDGFNSLCIASCNNLKIRNLVGEKTIGIIRSSLSNSAITIDTCIIPQLNILYGAQNVFIDKFISRNAQSSALNINTGGYYDINRNIKFNSIFISDFNQNAGDSFTDSALFIANVSGLKIGHLFVKNETGLINNTYAMYCFGKNVEIDSIETELVEDENRMVILKDENCSIKNVSIN